MTPKNCFTRIIVRSLISALLTAVFFTFALPARAQAQSALLSQPDLNTFIASVQNGDANMLRGAYVANVMSYPIVQQPEGEPGFVSTQPSVVTQFEMAARAGNIGLLAHNNLGGRSFANIVQGNQVILVYGDGRTQTFVVENILMYQVLPYGQYKDLQTQTVIGVGELFTRVYEGGYHVTLQTCIESAGDLSWGRLFIIATPVVSDLLDNTPAASQ